jgi:hypothetical protein
VYKGFSEDRHRYLGDPKVSMMLGLQLVTVLSAAVAANSLAVRGLEERASDNGACDYFKNRCANAFVEVYTEVLDYVFAIEPCVLGATCIHGYALLLLS